MINQNDCYRANSMIAGIAISATDISAAVGAEQQHNCTSYEVRPRAAEIELNVGESPCCKKICNRGKPPEQAEAGGVYSGRAGAKSLVFLLRNFRESAFDPCKPLENGERAIHRRTEIVIKIRKNPPMPSAPDRSTGDRRMSTVTASNTYPRASVISSC